MIFFTPTVPFNVFMILVIKTTGPEIFTLIALIFIVVLCWACFLYLLCTVLGLLVKSFEILMCIKFLVENELEERIIYSLLLKTSLVKGQLYSYRFTSELFFPLLFYFKNYIICIFFEKMTFCASRMEIYVWQFSLH